MIRHVAGRDVFTAIGPRAEEALPNVLHATALRQPSSISSGHQEFNDPNGR